MSVPKRFGVLRFFATLLKVLAWIVLVVAILAAVGVVLAGSLSTTANIPGIAEQFPAAAPFLSESAGAIAAVALGIGILLYGLIIFLALYVAGDQLHMFLAIEENTRLTAALLLRMHQESGQAEAAQGYGSGGFSNEPYDT